MHTRSRSWLPQFSVRTLLILVGMLVILLAQRPYTRVVMLDVPSTTPYVTVCFGPSIRVPTDRFINVAIAEAVVIAVWAFVASRRPRGTPMLVWDKPKPEQK